MPQSNNNVSELSWRIQKLSKQGKYFRIILEDTKSLKPVKCPRINLEKEKSLKQLYSLRYNMENTKSLK